MQICECRKRNKNNANYENNYLLENDLKESEIKHDI